MDFRLTEEQTMFRQLFADFAANEVAPQAKNTDRQGALSPELLEKATMQGFMAALLPEEPYFGAALDHVSYCLLLEELGKACLSTAVTLHIHNALAARTILDHGRETQKEAYLPQMAEGSLIGAYALTEPEAGSDPGRVRTRTWRDGDAFVLDGTKTWVSNGEIAGLFIIFAQVEGDGLTAFLIERDTPGLTVGGRERTMGLRGLSCNTLYLDRCQVPAENVLGQVGSGLEIVNRAQALNQLGVSAICLGAAEASLEMGLQFAAQRKQFGVLIAEKQAIQNFVADTKLEIEMLRDRLMHTAWLADAGEPYDDDANITKLYAGQVAYNAANRMIQVHGGYGYIYDYQIERIYRDVRALEFLGGTGQLARVAIAQRLFAAHGVEIRP
ncbi:MAG TPA: acyl-CoA dehydrogenase [Anaerolineae bacterium]|nr:acyl-CoA dehydrogenase [Anaerolineae bacterium]